MAQQICTNTYAIDHKTMYPYDEWIGSMAELGEYMFTTGTCVYALPPDADDTLSVFTLPIPRTSNGIAYWDSMGHVSFGPTSIPYALILGDSSSKTVGPTDTELNTALETLDTELDDNDLSSILHSIYGKYGSFMVGTDWGVEVTDELQYCHLRVSPTVCRYRDTGTGYVPSGSLGRMSSALTASYPVKIGEVAHFTLPSSLASSYSTDKGNYICTSFTMYTGETPIQAAGYTAYGYDIKRSSTLLLTNGGVV